MSVFLVSEISCIFLMLIYVKVYVAHSDEMRNKVSVVLSLNKNRLSVNKIYGALHVPAIVFLVAMLLLKPKIVKCGKSQIYEFEFQKRSFIILKENLRIVFI